MDVTPEPGRRWRNDGKTLRLGLIAAAMLFVLLGCEFSSALPTLIPTLGAPQNTQSAPEAVVLSHAFLPDGSRLILKGGTQIDIAIVAGMNPQIVQNMISLYDGEVLVRSRQSQGLWFTVLAPNGFMARVSGSIMVVTYDPASNTFTVICISGICQIGPDGSNLIGLNVGEQGWLDGSGTFQGPVPADLDGLRAIYGADSLIDDPVATATFTETPTATGTDTPLAIFTLTPSPSLKTSSTVTRTPDIKATATAACRIFQQLHPATPCP